jgi:DNA-binding XRE family transcriptional regulator
MSHLTFMVHEILYKVKKLADNQRNYPEKGSYCKNIDYIRFDIHIVLSYNLIWGGGPVATKFRIGLLRKQKRIRQADLAAQIGVTREHLSAVENNRETPSVSLLEKIAATLGVSVAELLEK